MPTVTAVPYLFGKIIKINRAFQKDGSLSKVPDSLIHEKKNPKNTVFPIFLESS